jgi:hypothetical protein
MVTRGFAGRQCRSELSDRIPATARRRQFPGAYDRPTPRIEPADSIFTLNVGPRPVKRWSWIEFVPAAAAVVPAEGDVSVKESGATQMLSRTIDVDRLKVFCREVGTPGPGRFDIEIDCVAAL